MVTILCEFSIVFEIQLTAVHQLFL